MILQYNKDHKVAIAARKSHVSCVERRERQHYNAVGVVGVGGTHQEVHTAVA
jgi:hypothetical protein